MRRRAGADRHPPTFTGRTPRAHRGSTAAGLMSGQHPLMGCGQLETAEGPGPHLALRDRGTTEDRTQTSWMSIRRTDALLRLAPPSLSAPRAQSQLRIMYSEMALNPATASISRWTESHRPAVHRSKPGLADNVHMFLAKLPHHPGRLYRSSCSGRRV